MKHVSTLKRACSDLIFDPSPNIGRWRQFKCCVLKKKFKERFLKNCLESNLSYRSCQRNVYCGDELKRFKTEGKTGPHNYLEELHSFFFQAHVPTPLPSHSHSTDKSPANHQPCAFSALYISRWCSTEFRRLVWTNKTHFLRLSRGSHGSDVSTSPNTAEALYDIVLYIRSTSDKCQYSGFHSSLLMRGHILNVPNICTHFTLWRLFYSRDNKGWVKAGVCSRLLRIAWLLKGT